MSAVVELFDFRLLHLAAFAPHFAFHLNRVLLCLQSSGVHHERVRRVQVSSFGVFGTKERCKITGKNFLNIKFKCRKESVLQSRLMTGAGRLLAGSSEQQDTGKLEKEKRTRREEMIKKIQHFHIYLSS